jgi:hypothetical protein
VICYFAAPPPPSATGPLPGALLFAGSAARRLQSSSGWAVEIQPALQREIRPPPLLKGVRCGLDPTRSLAKLPGKQCGPNPTPSHSTAPGLTPPPLKGVQCGLDPTRSRAKLPVARKVVWPYPHALAFDSTGPPSPPPLKGVQCGLDPTRSREKLPGKQCGPNPSLSQSPAPAPDLTPSGAYILPGRFRSPVYGKAKLLPPSLRVALARPGARWAALKGRSGWVGSAAASRTRKNPPPPDEVWTWTVPQARCVCVFDTPTLQRTHRLPVSACRKPSPLHGDL